MALNDFELHKDRLSTTDEKGRRLYIYPADVRGFFRSQRNKVQAVLIAFFLLLPWLRIHGKQALLLDIAHRNFEIFGLSLRAHNAPLLLFVLAAAAFGLFAATAVFGRVWCGWACPQTVFIDGVFRRIERFIEGPALRRRELAAAAISWKKLAQKTTKWLLFLLATLAITHSFLAYFVGTEKLYEMILRPPQENWGSFLFMLVSSLIILFDFAWFREQFCTIVCPYGRFQSVLMDKGSMIVAYDAKRGEPRATPEAKLNARAGGEKVGDCVNCYRCVQVCPTGIDIRRGLQMECIACTSCIDACDDVMRKTKRPAGLIRYDTLSARAKHKPRLNFRAGIYLFCFLASVAGLLVSLSRVQPVDVQLLRATDVPYSSQSFDDGTVMVLNHFHFEISNQSGSSKRLLVRLSAEDIQSGLQLIMADPWIVISDDSVARVDFFIRFQRHLLQDGHRTLLLFIDENGNDLTGFIHLQKEVTVVGPFS